MLKTYNGFDHAARMKADRWLKEQYAKGTIARATECRACGQTKGALLHHCEDYGEPFGPHTIAFPLCYRCHMSLHCRFSNKAQWDRYRLWLRSGGMAAPCGWSVFTREHFGLRPFTMDPSHTVSVLRERTVLDEIEEGLYVPNRGPHAQSQEAPEEQEPDGPERDGESLSVPFWGDEF